MEKILKAKNYTMIFSGPDIILYGHVDGNLCVYQDEAEEFAKSFFSKDILSRDYQFEKELTDAKHWLFGILYHERKNSVTEVMDMTGYKSVCGMVEAIKKFGPLRSIKEGVDIAFEKRYGDNMSGFMKKKWREMDSKKRKEMGRVASKALLAYWEKRKSSEASCKETEPVHETSIKS